MRERVRYFKGEMDIESNGTGTTLTVNLPVAATQLTALNTV
jgi:signal transduction histidine kinase